jgi:hypothetical protein
LSSQSYFSWSAAVNSGFLFAFVPAIQLRDMGLHAYVQQSSIFRMHLMSEKVDEAQGNSSSDLS